MDVRALPLRADGPRETPLRIAFDRFNNTLSSKERAIFTDASLNEILLKVREIDNRHATSSKLRSVNQRLEHFLNFLQRYSRAIDCLVQAQANPSALIWGLLRIVLEAANSFSEYFKKLVCMIERLGDSLSIYYQYEELFGDNERFKIALTEVYYHVLVFLKQAKDVFTLKGFRLFGKVFWQPFENEFQNSLESISHHTHNLQEEISLAHRKMVQDVLTKQAGLHVSTCETLLRIESQSFRRQRLMDWLSPVDMEEVFVRESQRRCQPCGQWFLNQQPYNDWLETSNPRMIWITAPPGAGKTVLSASIIESIRKAILVRPQNICTFFYGDKKDLNSQSTCTVLVSLLSQILACLEEIPAFIYTVHENAVRFGRSRMTAADFRLDLLKELILSMKKVYIIIDGLDEFTDPMDVVSSVQELINSLPNVQFLVLSRDDPLIKIRTEHCLRINMTSAETSYDVASFISKGINDLGIPDENHRKRIKDQLLRRASGMFLWAHLTIESLKLATSLCEIDNILSHMPVGLEVTYGAILKKLARGPHGRQALTKRILLWTRLSARNLHWAELEHAVASVVSSVGILEFNIPFKSSILELCSPLVEYHAEQDIFRLIHSSVGEYLNSSHFHYQVDDAIPPFLISEANAHQELAKTCLRYLSHVACQTQTDSAKFPLLDYTVLFWCYHCTNSTYDHDLEHEMSEFLFSKPRRQFWISQLLFCQSSTFPLQRLMKMQRSLAEWIAGNTEKSFDKRLIDWMQDVPEILIQGQMLLAPSSIHSPSHGYKAPEMTYFDKMMVMRDLVREFTMSGRLVEGEQWLTEALETQKNILGPGHVSVAWLMNSLGLLYDQQRRVELSMHTHEQALALQWSHFGPDHPETIWTVNELGRVYRHLHQYDLAEKMHLHSLQILRRMYSSGNLEMAWTLNTLARTYRKQGRYEEALELHEEAIKIQTARLGSDHPHTLWAITDVARCYHDRGLLQKSAEMHQYALSSRENVLGPNHLDTLWSMNDLAIILSELNDPGAALLLHQKARLGQAAALGENHPHCLWTTEAIAKLSSDITG